MNISDRFGSIIQKVEHYLLLESIPKNREIAERIAFDEGLSYRDFNTIFTFISNMSFLDYISLRRMVKAYQALIEFESFDLDLPIILSGYENENSFRKEFKTLFGLTPKEAYLKKDQSAIQQPLSWNTLNDYLKEDHAMKTVTVHSDTFLGLPREHYEQIIQAINLQELYSFNEQQTNAAYQVAEYYKIDIRKAFEFIESYCLHWYNDGSGHFHDPYSTFNMNVAEDYSHYLDAFTRLNISVRDAASIIDELRSSKYSMKDVNKAIIQMSGKVYNLTLPELIMLYKKCPPDMDYELLVMEVETGSTIQEAIQYYRDDLDSLGKPDDEKLESILYESYQDELSLLADRDPYTGDYISDNGSIPVNPFLDQCDDD